jgi:hypothetical protein
MPLERDRHSVILEVRVTFGNRIEAVTRHRTDHRIASTCHPDTAELHGNRTRRHGPAAGVPIPYADDVFHVYLLFQTVPLRLTFTAHF